MYSPRLPSSTFSASVSLYIISSIISLRSVMLVDSAKAFTSSTSFPESSIAIALCREYALPILFMLGSAEISSGISTGLLSTVLNFCESTQYSARLDSLPSS